MMQRVKWFKCDDLSFAKVGSIVLFSLNTRECMAAMMKTMFRYMSQHKVIGFTGNQHMPAYCATLTPVSDFDPNERIMLFGHPFRVVDIATEHCSVRMWFVIEGNMSGDDIDDFLQDVVSNTNPNDDAHAWGEVIEVKP